MHVPIPCERCQNSETAVDKMHVEHRPDESGVLVPSGTNYELNCPACGHRFERRVDGSESPF
jgi:hypothetical protein